MEIKEVIKKVSDLNLTIEICGNWVWLHGDTRPHKDILKTSGFKWAPKKKLWYWRPAEYRSFSRGKFSMNEIREKHGSQRVS